MIPAEGTGYGTGSGQGLPSRKTSFNKFVRQSATMFITGKDASIGNNRGTTNRDGL